MTRKFLFTFALTVLAATQAVAQTRDWSGYWLGVGVGASRGEYDVSDSFCSTSADTTGDAAAAAACSIGAGGISTAAGAGAGGNTAAAAAAAPGSASAASAGNSAAAAAASTPPGSSALTTAGTASAATVIFSERFALSTVTAVDGGNVGQAFAAGVLGNFDPDENNSVALGVNARYDYQYPNNFVLGLELDYVASPSSGFSSSYNADGFTAKQSAAIDANIASARVRLGYAAGDTLAYLTGGVALGHFDANLRSSISSVSFAEDLSSSDSASTTAVGGVIGGGISFWLPDNVVLSGEVLYYMFNDEIDFGNASSTSTAGNAAAAAAPGFGRSIDIENSLTAMIKLSFKLQ